MARRRVAAGGAGAVRVHVLPQPWRWRKPGARKLVDGLLRIERTVLPAWRAQILSAAALVAAASNRRDNIDSVALRVTQLAQNEGWKVPADVSKRLGW